MDPRAGHLLPQWTDRAGIQPLGCHFLLKHLLLFFSILGKTLAFSESGKALEESSRSQKHEAGATPHGHTPCLPAWEETLLHPPPHPSLAICSGWGLARDPDPSASQKQVRLIHLWSLQPYPRGLGSVPRKSFLSGSTHSEPRKAKRELSG